MAYSRILKSALISALTVAGLALQAPAADDPGSKPPTTPPAKTDSDKPSQESALDRFQAIVNGLKLTDEQKPKIDKLFDTARQDFKGLESIADAKEREQKSRVISTKLRSQIGDILTNEQKAELIKKMPQPIDTDAMIDRIKKELNKPGSKLTDDQKTQVDAVLDDTKKKLADLRADAKENHNDNRAKMQEVLSDMRQKLADILKATPKE